MYIVKVYVNPLYKNPPYALEHAERSLDIHARRALHKVSIVFIS